MKGKTWRILVFLVIVSFLFAVSLVPAIAQSHALNGQIEGTALDQNGAAVPNAHVTVTNIETGATRTLTADGSGGYRFPILPLGPYRITAEAANFRKAVQGGITLNTGQTAVVNLVLQIGDARETVTVSSDAPVADAAKIELGRVMNSHEVQNLPLITLNPYELVFLQSNVTGNRLANPGTGVANVNANGFSRRGNFQIDGNYATEVGAGGVRMLFLSRVYTHEIQLLTSGMNAEFGSTVGHVMNVVTPSGTNNFHGNVSYQFRRNGFAAQRFNVPPGTPKYDPTSDVATAAVGGPIIKDRWHFFAGFEAFKWDLVGASRQITISEANKQTLITAGVPASAMPTFYPAPQAFQYFIGRSDAEINSSNRLGVRFLLTNGNREKIGITPLAGNTLQVTQDIEHFETSLAGQLISNKGNSLFNELRVQRSARTNSAKSNEHTGTGDIAIRIDGVATFGAPISVFEQLNNSLVSFQNNLSLLALDHSFKLGAGFAAHKGRQGSLQNAEYRFPSIQHYVDAVTGVNRRGYSRYTDTNGDPAERTSAVFWNAFVQDDWRVSRRLKINAGLRYDLFLLPDADSAAAYLPPQKFRVDKTNFGPRLGLAYVVSEGRRPAVIRASAGLYYDPPIINFYLRALQGNGNPRSFSYTLDSEDGPEFPNRFQGQVLPEPDVEAIDPNFKTMSALHANLQFEKALSENLSFTLAYSHSSGRHIASSREVNCQPSGGTLADGRPLYGTAEEPCAIRLLPQFLNMLVWESVGNLNYNAATFTLTKRLSSGYQFSLNYTLSRSRDDTPEENIAVTAIWQSDPSNRRYERARSLADQTHTFVGTFVGRPRFKIANRLLNYLANKNQLSIIGRASDGERYNIRTTVDLNHDNSFIDRPVGIPRNFLKTPPFFNLDVRYLRNFQFSERLRLELFADMSNVTNTNSIVSYTGTMLAASFVNPLTGELTGPLPDFKSRGVVSTDSRRMQLGIKFHF